MDKQEEGDRHIVREGFLRTWRNTPGCKIVDEEQDHCIVGLQITITHRSPCWRGFFHAMYSHRDWCCLSHGSNASKANNIKVGFIKYKDASL